MPIIKGRFKEPLTDAQLKYVEQLAIDLQLSLHRRNAHIQAIIHRKINHLDELTKFEASEVITKFKEWKDNQNERGSNESIRNSD